MFEHLKIEMRLREAVASIFSEVSQWGHTAFWQQTIPGFSSSQISCSMRAIMLAVADACWGITIMEGGGTGGYEWAVAGLNAAVRRRGPATPPRLYGF